MTTFLYVALFLVLLVSIGMALYGVALLADPEGRGWVLGRWYMVTAGKLFAVHVVGALALRWIQRHGWPS